MPLGPITLQGVEPLNMRPVVGIDLNDETGAAFTVATTVIGPIFGLYDHEIAGLWASDWHRPTVDA